MSEPTAGDVALRPGDRVGNLVVEREIGRGGYGAVFLARDTLVGRAVALKELLPSGRAVTDAEREAFLSEARAIAAIPSPHIVTLHGVHQAPGGGWLIEMEYLDGTTLDAAIRASGRIVGERAREVARAVLDALRAAHERGVLHRDVKPGNVLVARDGTVKLADFGLALVARDAGDAATASGAVVGTPWYMAPELFLGEAATVQTDLWAAGVLVHEMLAGEAPFRGSRLPEIIRAVRNDAPPPLPADADPALVRVAQACLAKRPEDRPRSAAQLLAAIDRAAAPRAAAPAVTTGLVGRTAALTRVAAAMTDAVAGRPRVVVVRGDEGMGKSAFLAEARRAAAPLGFRVIALRLAAGGGLVRPLVEAVRAALAPGGDRDAAERALETRDLGVAPTVARRVLRDDADLAALGAEQVAWLLDRILRGLAGGEPLCVAVDDAHLASDEELALLRSLVERVDDGRVLVLASARPGGAAALTALPGAVVADLEPLGPDAIYALLRDCADGLAVPPAVADRIARRSAGNPLLATELFRHMVQTGAVVAGDGGWRTTDGWEDAPLPESVRATFEGRVAHLDADDREALEACAAAGPAFDGESVAEVLGVPAMALLRRLQRMVRRGGLLASDAAGFRFEHPLLRDVVLGATAPELRRAMHAGFARILEARGGADPARLGALWESAGEPARARPYLVEAAGDAARRLDRGAALDLARRAGLLEGEAGPDLARTRGRALTHVGWMLCVTGHAAAALRILDAVARAASAAGDAELAAVAAIRAVLCRHQSGAAGADDRAILLGAAAALPRTHELALANYTLGLLARRAGDLDEAERRTRLADELSVELGLEPLHASALNALGAIAERRGDFARAEALWAEAAAISERSGSAINAAISQVNRVGAAIAAGRIDGIRPELERAVATLEVRGEPSAAAAATAHLASLCYALGDLRAADDAAARAVRAAEALRDRPPLFAALCTSASYALALGRVDEAADRCAEAEREAAALGDDELSAQAAAVAAAIAAWCGDPSEAAVRAHRALDATAAAGDSPDVVVTPLLSTVLAGVGGDVWRRARSLLAAARGAEPRSAETLAAAVDGAVAWAGAEPGHDVLVAASDALAGPAIGDLRAELRIVGLRFGAEAAQRRGDRAAAFALVDQAAVASARLGHVWLELSAARAAEGLAPSPERRERCRALVRRVTAEVRSPDLARRIAEAWEPA